MFAVGESVSIFVVCLLSFEDIERMLEADEMGVAGVAMTRFSIVTFKILLKVIFYKETWHSTHTLSEVL